ncbi:MAG: thiol-disulfide oxidoreductase DCC family protein [Candidatus Limnocylindria bacterium]
MGRKDLPARARLIVCYDGECGVCLAAIERLRKLDSAERLRFMPAQRVTSELPEFASRIEPGALSSALHVVEPDGQWVSGAEAVLRIAETVPRLRPIARLGRLPVVNRLVEPLYQLVARHRHRLSRLI